MYTQKLQNPLVSVIIPTYNSSNYIGDCLNSLFGQTSNYPFEVIIADSSNDGTAGLVERKYPQVRLIKLSKRTFPGRARNIAISKARGQIIACIDSDCIADHGWIDYIVAAHQKGRQVVGGAVINGTPESFTGTSEYFMEFSEYHPAQKQKSCRMIPTCNLSFDQSIFEKISGFDQIDTGEKLFKSEDTLFCYRINQLNVPIFFEPSIRVYHRNRIGMRHIISNQISLGFSSAVARRVAKMKGSFLVNHIFFVLLIPLIKVLILMRRSFNWGFIPFTSFLIHLPLILIGSCCYAVGFACGRRISLTHSLD